MPAAKSQNFVNNSGAEKPTWAKFLKFDFFIYISEKARLYRSYQSKNELLITTSSYLNLAMKFEIKLYF